VTLARGGASTPLAKTTNRRKIVNTDLSGGERGFSQEIGQGGQGRGTARSPPSKIAGRGRRNSREIYQKKNHPDSNRGLALRGAQGADVAKTTQHRSAYGWRIAIKKTTKEELNVSEKKSGSGGSLQQTKPSPAGGDPEGIPSQQKKCGGQTSIQRDARENRFPSRRHLDGDPVNLARRVFGREDRGHTQFKRGKKTSRSGRGLSIYTKPKPAPQKGRNTELGRGKLPFSHTDRRALYKTKGPTSEEIH